MINVDEADDHEIDWHNLAEIGHAWHKYEGNLKKYISTTKVNLWMGKKMVRENYTLKVICYMMENSMMIKLMVKVFFILIKVILSKGLGNRVILYHLKKKIND